MHLCTVLNCFKESLWFAYPRWFSEFVQWLICVLMLSTVAGLPAGYWPVSSWYLWQRDQLWRSLSYWFRWTTSGSSFLLYTILWYGRCSIIRRRNLLSSVCVLLIFRQIYIFPRILCTYYVRNIYIAGLGGVITLMAHVKYGLFGHLNHARRGGSHGLLNLDRSVGNDSGKNNLSFGLLNIWSLSIKGPLVYDLLSDRNFDFLCLTDT